MPGNQEGGNQGNQGGGNNTIHNPFIDLIPKHSLNDVKGKHSQMKAAINSIKAKHNKTETDNIVLMTFTMCDSMTNKVINDHNRTQAQLNNQYNMLNRLMEQYDNL